MMIDERRLMLHICCAPDATVPWPDLRAEKFSVTGFFYGSNIHPEGEYIRRLRAVEKFAGIMKGELVVAKYAPHEWLDATREFATEPEGGLRCPVCFEQQLRAAGRAAAERGYRYLCTTLTISPHKDPDLLNRIGRDAAKSYGLIWVDRIWRKNDGFLRSVRESRRLEIYRQNYCGCVYSMRNSEA